MKNSEVAMLGKSKEVNAKTPKMAPEAPRLDAIQGTAISRGNMSEKKEEIMAEEKYKTENFETPKTIIAALEMENRASMLNPKCRGS